MIKARYDPIISNTLIVSIVLKKKKSNGKTLFVKIGGARNACIIIIFLHGRFSKVFFSLQFCNKKKCIVEFRYRII